MPASLQHVLNAALILVAIPYLLHADEHISSITVTKLLLTIRLIDPEGKPVVGAQFGEFYSFNHEKADWMFDNGVTTGVDGIAKIRIANDEIKRLRIYARHVKRHLVAVQTITEMDVDEVVTMKMRQECKISCRMSSSDLTKLGRKLRGMVHSIALEGVAFISDDFSMVEESAYVPAFEAYLPPGKFELTTFAAGVHPIVTPINIAPGQHELDLGILDHTATKLELLYGKLAPELPEMLEWKNGPPVKLADLRGKVVLLEFWGWWCGACVHRGLPDLFKLQEEYRGTDLRIIGIHVDNEGGEIDSVNKLDERLTQVKRDVWKGQDITFPVALAAVGKQPVAPSIEKQSRVPLCEDYGIIWLPTAVLIDRDGKVLGQFLPHNERDRSKLKKLLNTK